MRVVVCGAGIAGVSVAFQLAVDLGVDDVVIVDRQAPLTLTSDKSTECYRNWWPEPDMVAFMNRSIDLLEDFDRRSGSAFHLNRRGYLYVTGENRTLAAMASEGHAISGYGAGPFPEQAGAKGAVILERHDLRRHYPFLTHEAVGGLLVHRAGWMSAQQLGAWMLDQALTAGATLTRAQVVAVQGDDRVDAVRLDDGSEIRCDVFVNAAGPLLPRVSELLGVHIPLHSEAHHKVAFRDHLGVVDRDAPMLIWCDPQSIGWTDEERSMLADLGRSELLGPLPAYCHGRPEGGPGSTWMLALWEHTRIVTEPTWPMHDDELHPEIVMRGMTTMIPGLAGYLDHMPQPFVDGGYYTKAPDNLPVVGGLGPVGAFVCGGLSGYGVMAASAAGELTARHILELELPSWAGSFRPSRLFDPSYLATIDSSSAGQL